MPPTQEQIDAYWEKVKTLQVYEQPGTGSDNYRTLLIVDWSSQFAGTTRQSASWVLGFDPISQQWIDDKAQFLTMSQWLMLETNKKISDLDERVSALEGK